MRHEAVIFDLFGTLVPKWSSSLASATLRRLCEILQLDHETFRRAWRRTTIARETGEVSWERGLQLAIEACTAVEPQRLDEAIATWLELVRSRLTPREDVLDVLTTCRRHGLRVGLLSDCNDDVPRILRNQPIAAAFDTLAFSCELGVMKPDARAYLEVCRRLGVEPEHCAYVGDGGSNELRGAEAVGMTAVFLRHEGEIEREGLPAGARGWQGPTIERLPDLWTALGI